MGKTTVLDTVTTGAGHNGVRVLRAAGMQFEADINYAGLKPLLVPLFNDFDILDDVHRDALRAAVGIRCRPAPDGLLTSTAVLLLLRLISAPNAAPARHRRTALAGPGDQRRARLRGPTARPQPYQLPRGLP
ncbi:hypothetical protein ACFY13_28050 [Streptomyces mirabilis]|uniref:hypothetical protein n=1 Tax=Streptomyces mirabilis TaxID=68239 RepID=UPI0036882806